MTTVTLFTVTSLVWPVVRSMFFKRTYLDRLFLPRESLLEDLALCGLLPPGSWLCWALTSAELSRGLRVEVPKIEISVSDRFDCYCLVAWTIKILISSGWRVSQTPTQTQQFSVCHWKCFHATFRGFPSICSWRNHEICGPCGAPNRRNRFPKAQTKNFSKKPRILPFLTSHMRHLNASAVFLKVHTLQSQ